MEVPSHDERQFTPHAEAGWLSWDGYSPEQDFCRWVGAMQRILRPAVVLETGVGLGRLTSHLDLGACMYLGFESDPDWRRPPADPSRDTPTAAELGEAALVVLDSDPPYRLEEFNRWVDHGRVGSVCIVHDCGNGHPPGWSFHHSMHEAVEKSGLPGILTRNPRGGWMGWHP